jgi:hypothetical protein
MQPWCKIRLDIGHFFVVPFATQGTLKGLFVSDVPPRMRQKVVIDFRLLFGET